MRKGEEITRIDYGTSVTYQKDKPIFFKDFSIRFTGADSCEPEQRESVTLFNLRFVVSDYNGKEQKVTVTSSQIPPKEKSFAIGDKHFKLFTYLSPKGYRLEKEQFVIIQN